MADRSSPPFQRTRLALSVGLVVVLAALAACGGDTTAPEPAEAPTTATAPEPAEAPTTTTAPEPAEVPTTTTAPEPAETPTTTTAPEPAEPPSTTTAPEPAEAPTTTTAPEEAPSLTVTDGSGREITLDRPAERIVCLEDNCTDLTSDLGIVPVAHHRGGEWGTAAAYYGPAAADIPVIGDRTSVEEVAAFAPDLIIARVGQEEVRDAVELVAPVYLVDIGSVETLKEGWMNVGVLTGREAEADEAIHRFEHNIEHLAEDLPAEAADTRVALGFGDTNWMLWDSSSFCEFLHDAGAGTCVFPAQPESEYGSPDSEFSWEFIVEADPEVWVMITWPGSARADSVAEAAWLETSAYQQGRICNEDSAGSFGHGLLMFQWAFQCYLNAGWPSIYDHPGDLAVWHPEDH